jgi:Flp pilus assembly protein TadG
MYLLHFSSRDPARGRVIRSAGHQRMAAALVEFAVVSPIMFMLILAIFEFGRTFMVMELLTEGARVGCRQAIIEGTSSQQIRDTVTNYLTGLGINGDTVGVIVSDGVANTVEAATQPAYTEMTVKVTVPVTSISWVPNPFFTSGTLSGQFTMRRE